MASFKPTKVQTYPKLGEKVTEDALYWKNYKAPVQIKEFGAVTRIEFSPLPPHNYVVTASTRIQVYGPHSQEPLRSFTRFRDTAYGGSFRSDGKLLVAGSEEGIIRLFDISGRVALRQFAGHSKAVHVASFLSDGFRVVSGSDDLSCRMWDVASSTELSSYTEHTDYIRAAAISRLNPDLFITGSYDHTVKVFDARLGGSVMTLQHGHPVESVLLYPSEALLVSTGGRYVKVWDLLKGGQQLVSLKNHHKTVTCACLSTTDNRLLTGSLDRHVKVYNSSYKVVHSFDYAASILSLAVAPEDEVVAVGMTNGVLSVRHRKHSEDKQETVGRKRRGPAYRMFVKGKNYVPKQDDFVVSKTIKQHLQKYDKQLKSFQVSKALDTALQTWKRFSKPDVTIAVMMELNRRGTLRNALAGRDEKSLTTLLQFLLKHITDSRFSRLLMMVADIIIELYYQVIPQAPIVERLLQRLMEVLGREAELQQELLQVLGVLDTLFASLTPRKEVMGPTATPIMQESQLQAA
ncbi:U3 small nucleolar RNA-associated protein 15 homolog [Electrophorus electricus]|uniref:U3 small nucleolar RNA-associated protein 15 homolog n=1 Tax=Electrophorus electricus TaxID=8005 RepID=A0A4W4ENU6_ELEEL|nr:U3 small nucleolar RNA-associated protein 15 homolog [Electrophorus electricus]XP_026870954.2 U3 small nucleolar RNA-associated protein 15 homolog [Electrophorus electricus]